jgi:phosphatidylserine/phosphatidylglycerophosphate/cardiolipin synthase-like enzyme
MFLKSTFSTIVLALVAGSYALASDEITFDLMHTTPECHHPGKQTTWCTVDDQKAMAAKSGMEARVSEILDVAKASDKSRVTIAYFSFSNKTVLNKLCELGKSGVPIEGFFDSSQNESDNAAVRLEEECQGPDDHNVVVHFLAGTHDPWRLHHNKFLMVDPGNGDPVRLNFSSGNLSAFGLSLHFDHWVMMSAPKTSNLVKQHLCVVQAMRTAIDPKHTGKDRKLDDPEIYRSELESCLAKKKTIWSKDSHWIETALEKEKIAPLFSPDPSDSVAEVLIDHINRVVKGGKIYGAIQHFTHQGIAKALSRAAKRGVKVSMLMNDAILVGGSEVPGVKEFYDRYLTPSKSGIEMGFMQTNFEAKQMMHNKYLILEGVDEKGVTRVFSGAGHFTHAAMQNNYENFYVSQDDELTAKYQELYRYMKKNAMTEEEVLGE